MQLCGGARLRVRVMCRRDAGEIGRGWGDHLTPPGLDSRSCWRSQPVIGLLKPWPELWVTERACEREVNRRSEHPLFRCQYWINESTQMKTTAVRVESWVQAAPKGPAETETRGLCWGEPKERERESRRDYRRTRRRLRSRCPAADLKHRCWRLRSRGNCGVPAGRLDWGNLGNNGHRGVGRARAESGRRADNPPRQPDGRPVPLPTHKRDDLSSRRRLEMDTVEREEHHNHEAGMADIAR